MRILYHETTAYPPVSPLFIEALDDSGYQYDFVDEAGFIRVARASIARRLANRVMSHPIGYQALNREMLSRARAFRPDLVLVAKGNYISPLTLGSIKHETGAILVNYATDDPFNRQSRAISGELADSVPLYDLYASTKKTMMPDLRRMGCRNVVYVPFAYKPTVHFPERAAGQEAARFDSDVAFIGGCDADRAPLFEALVDSMPGIRLHLYGGYWGRYPRLRAYRRGFAFGADFRRALGGAKIALNLVRRANRDDHVMRTFEIPACGAFMLAERTDTHLALFEEGREAAYFDSAGELIDKIRYYLPRDSERARIAAACHRKVTAGGHTYADRLVRIIAEARNLRERPSESCIAPPLSFPRVYPGRGRFSVILGAWQ